jgi:hypothetical protein
MDQLNSKGYRNDTLGWKCKAIGFIFRKGDSAWQPAVCQQQPGEIYFKDGNTTFAGLEA